MYSCERRERGGVWGVGVRRERWDGERAFIEKVERKTVVRSTKLHSFRAPPAHTTKMLAHPPPARASPPPPASPRKRKAVGDAGAPSSDDDEGGGGDTPLGLVRRRAPDPFQAGGGPPGRPQGDGPKPAQRRRIDPDALAGERGEVKARATSNAFSQPAHSSRSIYPHRRRRPPHPDQSPGPPLGPTPAWRCPAGPAGGGHGGPAGVGGPVGGGTGGGASAASGCRRRRGPRRVR